jgi:hypothetical protein
LRTNAELASGWLSLTRPVGPVAGAVPGSMNDASAATDPAEAYAASSDPINIIDRTRDAETESGWNALAGSGSSGLGTREPARPGNATRARAAMSTDPTTNLLGRTRP